jgi:hypothetical protein
MEDEFDRRRQWLVSRFYKKSGAAKGEREILSYLRGGKKASLEHLLRDYDEEPLEDDETHQRDRVDDLLSYYSLREISALASYVPIEDHEPTLQRAVEILENRAVRRYSEQYHPQLLPSLFRSRLLGDWTIQLERSDELDGQMEEFLLLTSAGERDDDIETFLWFLDDGGRDEYDLTDTIDAVADPSSFVKSVSRSERNKNPLDRSVVGFVKFVRFCDELHSKLERMDQWTEVRAAAWHYWSYWLTEMENDLLETIQKAQEIALRDRGWESSADHSSGRIAELVDGTLGEPLLSAVEAYVPQALLERLESRLRVAAMPLGAPPGLAR